MSNAQGERSTTLFDAVKRGDLDALEALVGSGRSVLEKDPRGRTLLSHAAECGHVDLITELIRQGVGVDARDEEDGDSPLAYAASAAVVKELIENGAAVDCLDRYHHTPLINAVRNDRIDAAAELIRSGAAVNAKDRLGRAALSYAAESVRLEFVEELLRNGADLNTTDVEGRTPLFFATSPKVVKELVKSGSNINASDAHGRTPLSAAAENGLASVVVELIENGADTEAKDKFERGALSYAVQSGVTEIAVRLIKRGAVVDARDKYGKTPLTYASRHGHLQLVVELIKNGAVVDTKDMFGKNPLVYAADFGYVQVVAELIRRGVAVDAQDKCGKTALSHAASSPFNHVEIVSLELIRSGAVVDVKDKYGRTALSYTANRMNTDIAEELIRNGAAIDVTDLNGRTTLLHAADSTYGNNVALLLIKAGTDVNIRDKKGRTALSLACESGHAEVVAELIKNNVIINTVDKRGKSALSYAVQENLQAVIAELSRSGVFDSSLDSSDSVALFSAATMGDFEAIKELVSKGVPVDAATNEERTPLCYAAEFGRMDVVRFLLDQGASINVKSRSSGNYETPLSLAGRTGHMKVFQALIEAGAAVNIRNGHDQETPLLSAARWGFFSGVQLLLAHGGCLRVDGVPADEYPLIPGTLDAMGKLCAATFEYERVCYRFVERCQDVCSQLQQRDAAQVPRDTLVSFANIIFRFCGLLLQVEKREAPLSRFIGIRATFSRFQDFHEELDHFVGMLGLEQNGDDWKAHLEEDRSSLRVSIEDLLETEEFLSDRYTITSQKLEVTTLLQYELQPRGEEVPSSVQEGIKRVLERFRRECDIEPAAVPDWFISREDVEFQNWNLLRSERDLEYYDGKWRKTSVTIESSSNFEPQKLSAAGSQWSQLSHPNLIKLFGVCNLGSPKFFICESVPKFKQLQEILCEDSNRELTWKLLYGTALGLQYIHARGVVHADLRSENILVGSDLVPKLCGLRRCYMPENPDDRSKLNWMAPEVVLDDSFVSIESNVYSFGMCIWEAITLELPWKDGDRQAVRGKLLDSILPDRPASIGDAEWSLITMMCTADPKERVNITYVVNRLKQFLAKDLPTSSGETQIRDQSVDEHAFAELDGASISTVLRTIKSRSEKLPDHQWMATSVYPALEYIHKLLQEQQKSPGDLAVVKFCVSLSRFQRYLRTAVSEKSVFELARSRQVAESHHVVYADLDRLLDMLDVSKMDPIRVWRSQGENKSSSQVSGVQGSDSTSDHRLENESSSAVLLNHIDPDSPSHVLWTRDGLLMSSTTPSWNLPLQDLIFSDADQIGQGAFGAVYKGLWLDTPVVVKFMGYEEDIGTISTDLLLHEVRVWHRLSHPHVLKLFGASHVAKRYFVCEFASNGDLTDYLKKQNGESSRQLMWKKMYEAALGLEYLHGQNVAHNDLKCDNIMVGMDGNAKLIDFGLSCLLNEAEIQIQVKKMGAVHWRSPEYLAGGRPSFASDVFSFAMCIIEVASGDIPWGKNMPPAMVRLRVKKKNIPVLPESLNEKQRNLIQLMTKFEPSERVKIGYVVDKLNEIAYDELAKSAP